MSDEAERKGLRSHVQSYGAAATTAVGGVLVTISVYEEFRLARRYLLWGGLALVAIGVVAAILTFGEFRRLANFKRRTTSRVRRDAMELRPVLPRLLRRVAQDVGAVGPDFRLSLYQYQGDKFALVARYTENPDLARTNNVVYSATAAGGAIKEAWDHGLAMLTMLPTSPVARKQAQEHLDAPEGTHLARSIAAQALSYDDKRVGILTIESIKARGVSGAMLDKLRTNPLEEVIAWMVGSLLYSGVQVDITQSD